MVSESIIERVLERFEQDAALYEEAARHFGRQQPELLQYILSVPEGVLTPEEGEYLLYLAIIIWQSVCDARGSGKQHGGKAIEAAEEKNWELWESGSGNFNQRLDSFFEKTDQEDLLAFVEDSLTLDEEDEESNPPVTKEGAEPVFIALKTLIDLLTNQRS